MVMFGSLSLLVPEGDETITKKLARACKRCGVTLEQVQGQTTLSKLVWRKVRDERCIGDDLGVGWREREVAVHAVFDRYTLSGFPGLSGYEFLCRIEHTEAGNIVSGPEPVDGWRDAKPTCDHCCKVRRRNDTFVLRHNESGRVARVGRNCLADFLRSDPTQLVRFSELCRMLSDDTEWGGGGGRWRPETTLFLACAIASIDARGFRKSNMERSTRNDASFLADPCPTNANAAASWKEGQPKQGHHEMATKVLEWLRNDCGSSTSDYLTNLHVVSQLDCVSGRHAGLLASAPVAWAKAKEFELHKRQEREKREALPESQWLGDVKGKVVFTGTLLRTRDVESDWGKKTLYVFRTDEGSDVVWWCSGREPRKAELRPSDPGYADSFIEAGDRVHVRGTVKAHETYQGRKQTTILRAKVTFVAAAGEQDAA
jgi:hypothetical protein